MASGEVVIRDVPISERTTIDIRVPEEAWSSWDEQQRTQYVRQAISRAVEAEFGPVNANQRARQFGSGASARALNVLEFPGVAAEKAINLGVRGVNAATGAEIPEMDFWHSQPLVRAAEDVDLPLIGPLIDEKDPRIPGYYETGGYTTDAITALTGLGAAGWASRARNVASASPTAVGPVLRHSSDLVSNAPKTLAFGLSEGIATRGGEVIGGAVAERAGLPVAMGEAVGMVAAPGALSSAAAAGAAGSRYLFARDPEYASRMYAALDKHGITPSPALIGSELSSTTEGVLRGVPGSSVEARHDLQVGQTESALQRQAEYAREGAPRRVPTGDHTTPGVVGQTVINSARDALEALQARLGDLYAQSVDTLGGPKAVIPIQNILDEIDNVRRVTAPQTGTILSHLEQTLRATKLDPINPQLDSTLRQTKEAKLRQLASLGNRPRNALEQRQIGRLQADIESLDARIEANLGVRAEVLEDWRNWLGKPVGDLGTLPGQRQAPIYRETRTAQRGVAQRQGRLDEFNETVAEMERLRSDKLPNEVGGEIPLMESIVATDRQNNPKAVYDMFFGASGREATGRLSALKRSLPTEGWNQLKGDLIEGMMLPRSANQRNAVESTELFSPAAFTTNWMNLPSESKRILFRPDTIEALDQLAEIAKAINARRSTGTGANVSRYTIATGAAVGVMSGNAATTLGTLAALDAAAIMFLSREYTRILARETPGLTDRTAFRAILETSKAGAREIPGAESPDADAAAAVLSQEQP